MHRAPPCGWEFDVLSSDEDQRVVQRARLAAEQRDCLHEACLTAREFDAAHTNLLVQDGAAGCRWPPRSARDRAGPRRCGWRAAASAAPRDPAQRADVRGAAMRASQQPRGINWSVACVALGSLHL